MRFGEPFIGCSVASPEGFMCMHKEGHDGAHECNEWQDGELTGRNHIWGSDAAIDGEATP